MGFDVICLGELFIDLTPHSKTNGQWLYAPSPGGAPGNVAVGLARLGRKVLMLSRVGDEAFGRLLVSALKDYGVDTSGVVLSTKEKTGLSVVSLAEDGDRSFMFYHDEPADLNIDPDDIDADMIAGAGVLHVGVLPFSGQRSAIAQRKAMDAAAAAGVPVSCDLNFRPNLWAAPSAMLEAGRFLVSRSTIVKMSEEELEALQGRMPMDEAVAALWHKGLRLLSITRGAEGAVIYAAAGRFACNGFRVNAIDTTGAGDAYTAALLSRVRENGIDALDNDEVGRVLRWACAAGALATTRKGAMEGQPTIEEVAELMTTQDVAVTFTPRS